MRIRATLFAMAGSLGFACSSDPPFTIDPGPAVARDGGPIACTKAEDCAALSSECATGVCVSGRCQRELAAYGIEAKTQDLGVCFDNICDGAGNVIATPAPLDVKKEVDSCLDVRLKCSGRTRTSTPEPRPNGTACGDGAVCGGGACLTCAGGLTCGPKKNESCCDSRIVDGGVEFRRDANATYKAKLGSFRMDRFEVTVGRFRRFVDAGEGVQDRAPAEGAGSFGGIFAGWAPSWKGRLPLDKGALTTSLKCGAPVQGTWSDSAGPDDNKPINCVSWYLAYLFCLWDGGRLPTEAEWVAAAQGAAEERQLPWPNSQGGVSVDRAVYSPALLVNAGSTSPQGDGRWGHADLAGSVAEWVLDGYTAALAAAPCDPNCVTPFSGPGVARGGSFLSASSQLGNALSRQSVEGVPLAQPSTEPQRYGMRCVRNP